jgi:undecaprenyl diphosphate synthase
VAEGGNYRGLIPVHLGLILDGNRRWARAHGLPQLEGHRRGYMNLHTIALAAAERGIGFVSAYVFSTENWDRSQEEVDYLMELLIWVATKEVDKYLREGMRLVFLGSRVRLSARVLRAVDSAERKTAHNTRLVLALCLNYGGHAEIAEGVARMIADGVTADEVTPARIAEYLYHPEIPPVDLLIRASGEQRLSGFMLWRIDYAELYFCTQHWPGFTENDLDDALHEYANRQRRFGK